MSGREESDELDAAQSDEHQGTVELKAPRDQSALTSNQGTKHHHRYLLEPSQLVEHESDEKLSQKGR